ncbi:MAG TPA: isoprenylcysteine carboxylmethyltransferase family protein [Ramlibacter sp.]|nr:isoprenylcysteine carboxylmethyltransferase family protein [Ramlibacter sp.]
MPAPKADWLELKIPPPVIAVAAAAVMWGLARAFPAFDVPNGMHAPAAVLIAFAGVILAASGIVTFRRARTTINPHKPGEATALVSSGPYRFTRNPMYAGLLLVLLAWAAFLSSLSALLGPVAFVLYINRFQIAPEERTLQLLFGSEYAAYKTRVRRWL